MKINKIGNLLTLLTLLMFIFLVFLSSLYANNIDSLRKKCDDNIERGCYNLGVLYDQGKETKQDYAKAIKYFQQACNAGNRNSCFTLNVLAILTQGKKNEKIITNYTTKHSMSKRNYIHLYIQV